MKRFTLTEDHVKLVREMNVVWEEGGYDGAPAVDEKRPYGNSDVPGDVHEALTGQRVDGDEVVLNRAQREAYLALHRETETALQVILATGAFEPGDYTAPEYTKRWVRA